MMTDEAKEARKASHKRYYENNRERILEKSRQYRESHKDEIKKSRTQYWNKKANEITNPNEKENEMTEEAKKARYEYIKQWRAKNKEKVVAQHRRYYEKHKDEIKAKQAEYQAKYWAKKAKEKKEPKEEPVADLVEITRCLNCAYYDSAFEYCYHHGFDREPNSYCSEGRRKEGRK